MNQPLHMMLQFATRWTGIPAMVRSFWAFFSASMFTLQWVLLQVLYPPTSIPALRLTKHARPDILWSQLVHCDLIAFYVYKVTIAPEQWLPQ